MKNLKTYPIDDEAFLPVRHISKKISQRVPIFQIENISHEKNAPKRLHKLVIDLDFSYGFDKAATKSALKRIRVIDELKITLKQNLLFVKEFLSLLMNIKIKKLNICIERYELFQPPKLKQIFSHGCNRFLQELVITLKLPGNYLNLMLTLSAQQHLKFTDKKFQVLCKRYMAGCPQLKNLQLNLKSQTLQNLTSLSLSSLGSSIRRLRDLSGLNLNVVLKDITDESLTFFSNCLAKKTELIFLKLFISGMRKVSPEILFKALSKLKNLRYLYLEIDPGWSEPNIQDLADACSELLNLESFYLNYTPLEKMAYNPLFDITLKKLVKLENLKLLLTSVYEEEFYEFSHALQFLSNLKYLDLTVFDISCFNQRTVKRLSDSLSKLRNLQKLNLRLSKTAMDTNHIKMLLNSFSSLMSLQEISFELFNCVKLSDSQILHDFYCVMLQIPVIRKVEVKLYGDIVFRIEEVLETALKEFIEKQKALQIFKLDLPDECFQQSSHVTFADFLKQFRKREFESFRIYQSGEIFFSSPLASARFP